MPLRCGPRARHINPSLVLVQPRNTRPYITERLLVGRKESNQTNKKSNSADPENGSSHVCVCVYPLKSGINQKNSLFYEGSGIFEEMDLRYQGGIWLC